MTGVSQGLQWDNEFRVPATANLDTFRIILLNPAVFLDPTTFTRGCQPLAGALVQKAVRRDAALLLNGLVERNTEYTNYKLIGS